MFSLLLISAFKNPSTSLTLLSELYFIEFSKGYLIEKNSLLCHSIIKNHLMIIFEVVWQEQIH